MKRLPVFSFVLALGLMLSTTASATPAEKNSGFSRQNLLQKAVTLPSPNIEAQVVKVHFPPGFKTPSHTHAGPGPRYVLKGQLRVVDNGEDNVYKAGQVFWETGSEMTVENVGKGDAEIIIFQMVPAK